MQDNDPDRYTVRTNDVTGQVVVGQGNVVIRTNAASAATTPVTDEERRLLRAEFARVRGLVPVDEPSGDRARALLDELEEAVTGEIDLTVMDYARGWFSRHLPALAAVVTGLIVHPVVTALVTTAGGDVAQEFHRRFGGS
ncbi:hypothetical protein [Streptomyces aureus]|uniref:hypothetical protein n=1 Tax=Streptomyces aureus TaxID=193461 RepID=UPI0034113E14